jgi:hypothetical protein
VFNTSRTAGLPNLPQDNIWVGDANGHPQAEPLCPFLLTDILATDTITACRWNGSSFDRYAISGQKLLDLATNVEDEGTPLPKRPTIDFQGAGVTATDDAGNNQTVVTIPGGGGGGSVWTPPKLGLEDITRGNTAPLLLSGTTGVRYVYFTDSTSGPGGVTNPTIEFTAYLGQDDGNDYDGSALSFRIHYQLFNTIPGVGTDNVRWSPQIYFIREGNDNINTGAVLGNPVDMNVLGKTPNLGYSEIITPQFNTGSPTGVRAIKVILRRLNSDAADTYPNDIDFLGIEIIN